MRRIVRSERVKLPRVQRIYKGGKVYKYHRTTGARLPVNVPEDHPDFIAAWTAQEARKRPVRPRHATGSIGAACGAFLASDRFLSLSSNYRIPVRANVSAIAEAYGAGALRDLRAHHIQSDLARLSANPARSRRKSWRLICGFAVETGLISVDPSDGTKAPKAPKTDGISPWDADDIAAFRAHWPVDHPRRLAFEVIYWTGARISDACRLTLGMVGRDGILTYRQKKTRGHAHVPWACDLPPFGSEEDRAHLMACIEAQRPEMALIVTQTGKPRSVKALSNWVTESARLAGVHRSAHGLRKARLIQLAEAGASALALQSWGGHKTLAEVQHYITAAERKRAILGPERKQNPVNGQTTPAKHQRNKG